MVSGLHIKGEQLPLAALSGSSSQAICTSTCVLNCNESHRNGQRATIGNQQKQQQQARSHSMRQQINCFVMPESETLSMLAAGRLSAVLAMMKI
jgi:hypothetical protein